MARQPNRPPRAKYKKLNLKTGWDYTWRKSWWHRSVFLLLAVVLLITASFYGLGQWYIQRHKKEPLVFGTTFVPNYAVALGLEPQETLKAILEELDVNRIRLVSYWKDIEATQGVYDFSGLDWQFAMAQQNGAKVSLAIGLRQPRWPECHEPKWALMMEKKDWQPRLYDYMTAVIERYKNHPALMEYQLENEFFMEVFGECRDFDRNRLIEEYNMVKRLDPNHRVVISRSNNWIGIPTGEPRPDIFGISVYKRVWDKTVTKRYFEYPLPGWFYAMLAGGGEILTGKNMFIHEMQAEPWTPNDLFITETSVQEQFKSFNAERFKKRIDYAKSTGMRTIDLWGAEWWYWLKQKQGDDSVWNVAKEEIQKTNNQYQQP